MQPISTFDPDRPSRLHDTVNDKMVTWQTAGRPNGGSTPGSTRSMTVPGSTG
jgi:hypothetical protein